VALAGVYKHHRSKIRIHFRHRSCRRCVSPRLSDIILKRYGTQGIFFFEKSSGLNPPLGTHRKASPLFFFFGVWFVMPPHPGVCNATIFVCLFDCLFVGIKPGKLYSASWWEGSKPPGHTRAEAQTAKCIPQTAAQTTYLSIHG